MKRTINIISLSFISLLVLFLIFIIIEYFNKNLISNIINLNYLLVSILFLGALCISLLTNFIIIHEDKDAIHYGKKVLVFLKSHYITVSLFIFLLLGLYYTYYGDVMAEEGAYLINSIDVYQGKLPYIDFAFGQGPIWPYIYGIPQLFNNSLFLGRITSLFFALASLLLSFKIIKKSGKENSWWVIFTILLTNLFTIHYLTSVVTYSLAVFFILLSIYYLTGDLSKKRNIFLSIFFAAISSLGIRLTFLPALILISIYIIIRVKKEKNLIFFTSFSLVMSILFIYSIFIIKNPFGIVNNIILNHFKATDVYGYYKYWGADQKFILRRDLAYDFFKMFFVIIITYIYTLFCMILNFIKSKDRLVFLNDNMFNILLFTIVLSVTSINLFRLHSFIVYFSLFTNLAAINSASIFSNKDNFTFKRFHIFFIFLFLFLSSLTFISQFNYRVQTTSPVTDIDEIGDFIKINSNREQIEILAFFPPITLESGASHPDKFERGFYSWSRELNDYQSEISMMLNTNQLSDYISSKKPDFIVLDDGYFYRRLTRDTRLPLNETSIDMQKIQNVTENNYILIEKDHISGLGNVYIYKK